MKQDRFQNSTLNENYVRDLLSFDSDVDINPPGACEGSWSVTGYWLLNDGCFHFGTVTWDCNYPEIAIFTESYSGNKVCPEAGTYYV